MTASLAYRKNEAAILRGDVPAKYTRLLPYIPRGHIVEIGCAEGVLACLLAQRGDRVVGYDTSRERLLRAVKLDQQWGVTGARFHHGDISRNRHALISADVLVAVRSIYYLGDKLDAVFRTASINIPNVVLCGNGNRAQRWRQGIREETKADNYYASREGMVDLLTRHGYRIEKVVPEGDEIVVGRMV